MTLARILTFASLALSMTACAHHRRAEHCDKPCADCPESAKKEAFGRLTVQEVSDLVAKNAASVFDDNREERYREGHVPGAAWLAYDAVTADELPADKDRTLVFYCANERCGACHKAAEAAAALGYTKVFIMPAGIAGWEAAGFVVEKG
jgi:rhodanese-related sulfurtransferase